MVRGVAGIFWMEHMVDFCKQVTLNLFLIYGPSLQKCDEVVNVNANENVNVEEEGCAREEKYLKT